MQDVVYVERLLAPHPTAHLLIEMPQPEQTKAGYWARTLCMRTVSFRSECAVMLVDHARQFSRPCEHCEKASVE